MEEKKYTATKILELIIDNSLNFSELQTITELSTKELNKLINRLLQDHRIYLNEDNKYELFNKEYINNILSLIKKKNMSYTELKNATNLSRIELEIIFKKLIKDKLIFLNNKYQYEFCIEDYVLDLINKNNFNLETLKNNTDVPHEKIEKTINKLLNDGKIFTNIKNRYETIKPDHIIGKLERDSRGKSFIIHNKEKIYIPDADVHTALKNDTIVLERTYQDNGTVLGIIKRQNNKLVCEVKEYNNKLILVPFNGNCEIHISIPKEKEELLKDLIVGDRVYTELDNSVDENNTVYINNITKIGHFNDKMNDEIAIAISKDFKINFDEKTIEEVEKIPTKVRESDKKDRVDLTNETIFTIDSIHTKDMDDAVSIKRLKNGNFLLGVHIADVAHYIKPTTNLFKEALERGTSVYLGDVVIPMIPSKLSNGICSLNEGVERLTKTCMMEVTPYGKVVKYKIYNSVIKSKKKMSYEDLNKMFNGEKVDDSYYEFIPDLKLMRELSNILTKKKNKKGNIDFESSDTNIKKDIFNNDKILGFEIREQKEAEKLIENFMILANETVASHFNWREIPFIYRVHDNPDEIKLDKTIDLIQKLNYKLVRIQNAYGPKAIQSILNDYKDTPEYTIISNLLLRSMQKAKYSTTNAGHYALALDNYCHFTSPIRRFPDLVVHSLIDIFVNNETNKNYIKIFKDNLNDMAEHSSYKERQENDAEKDYIKLKMAEYMEEHIDEEFIGFILDIDKDTIFVKLENNVKGILDMNNDFGYSFTIDSFNKELNSTYSKQKIKLGTKVLLKVSKVDIPQKEIYFEIKEIIKTEKQEEEKRLQLKND